MAFFLEDSFGEPEQERFAGDIFDLENQQSLQAEQQDSPAFPQAQFTDPYDIAGIEKVRTIGTDGSMKITVSGYDDSSSKVSQSILAGMDPSEDDATSINRDLRKGKGEKTISRDKIDQSPEFINPGAPQPGEPGYSGRALSEPPDGNYRDRYPGRWGSGDGEWKWTQEVGSDEEADALIRGIANRDERFREEAIRNTFGLISPRF